MAINAVKLLTSQLNSAVASTVTGAQSASASVIVSHVTSSAH